MLTTFLPSVFFSFHAGFYFLKLEHLLSYRFFLLLLSLLPLEDFLDDGPLLGAQMGEVRHHRRVHERGQDCCFTP